MNRRHFLVASSVALAGCSETPPVPTSAASGPTLSDEDRARIAGEFELRRKHLAGLEPFRVGRTEERKTPPPPVAITDAIPELKTQVRPAVRLHPRFGEEPPPDATKLGGQFLWPVDAPWPVCPVARIPMAAVLQLRELDKTPQIVFSPGCDLLQLLWSPRDPIGGELQATIVWRRRTEAIQTKLLPQKLDEFSYPGYVPVPCRVLPEWVGELPDYATLLRTDLRGKLAAWKPPSEARLSPEVYYSRYLASARGTKIGGWPRAALGAPVCKLCKHALDYLLTIDSSEWQSEDAARWRPVQDPDDDVGRRAVSGLGFSGGTAVEVSICRRCPTWPVRAIVVK